ncbi:hypothetical protein [Cystobacter fuscus]|uniref:hypothetical protein n=1 Tax=Cystobacter fuscus TaxID=43 RepID=UPI001FE1F7BF|nr:hypothetical protein [Cystobacter fuscus]
MALSLCVLLLSCGATRHVTPAPRDARELVKHVLVVERGPDGRMTHSWKPIEAFRVQYQYLADSRDLQSRVIQVSFNRDCEEELVACERMCLAGLRGRHWSHMTSGAKNEHCRLKCLQPYLDCNRLKELAEGKAVKFHALDDAIDWIERNSEKLLVGAVVVIAGVSFVVVVGASGGGALLLAPVIVLASSETASGPSFLAVHP